MIQTRTVLLTLLCAPLLMAMHCGEQRWEGCPETLTEVIGVGVGNDARVAFNARFCDIAFGSELVVTALEEGEVAVLRSPQCNPSSMVPSRRALISSTPGEQLGEMEFLGIVTADNLVRDGGWKGGGLVLIGLGEEGINAASMRVTINHSSPVVSCGPTQSGWMAVPPMCGNGLLEGTEQCDDENAEVGDGCAGCKVEDDVCGDGTWTTWVCDQDGCRSRPCEVGSDDPACIARPAVSLSALTRGRFDANTETPIGVMSYDDQTCTCSLSGASIVCEGSCETPTGPGCETLELTAEAGMGRFEGWYSSCHGSANPVCGLKKGTASTTAQARFISDSPGPDLSFIEDVRSSGQQIPFPDGSLGVVNTSGIHRFGPDGAHQWSHEIALSGAEPRLFISDVADLGSGRIGLVGILTEGMAVAGVRFQVDRPEGTYRREEAFALAFESNGDVAWSHLFAYEDTVGARGAQIVSMDGGETAVGYTLSALVFNGPTDSDVEIHRIDRAGQITMTHRARGGELKRESSLSQDVSHVYLEEMARTQDGDLIVWAQTFGAVASLGLPKPVSAGNALIRYGDGFELQWAVPFTRDRSLFARSMDVGVDQIVVLGGFGETPSVGDVSMDAGDSKVIHVLSFDLSGELRWQARRPGVGTCGVQAQWLAHGIVGATDDGGALVLEANCPRMSYGFTALTRLGEDGAMLWQERLDTGPAYQTVDWFDGRGRVCGTFKGVIAGPEGQVKASDYEDRGFCWTLAP